jgi:hypothetical protein
MNMAVAVLEASALASLAGSAVMFLVLAVAMSTITLGWDLLWVPVAILVIAMTALLVVLPSLVVLGIPLAFVLARYVHSPWLPFAAVLLGMIAGWLVARISELAIPGAGLIFGLAAGLFWYLRVRLVMIRIGEDKLNASPDAQPS